MTGHIPALSKPVIALLQPRPGAVVVDGTLGAGGHARLLLEAIQPGGRLLAIDRDPAAVAGGRIQLSGFEPPATVVRGDFGDLDHLARAHGFAQVDAVLFDLGISSVQLDDPARGFSFRGEGPLDMRMDPDDPVTAAQLANQLPERELTDLIRRLGEERWAARIASFIVKRRPLRTTRDLAGAVEAAVPRAAWPRDIHPATRTFQALRMAVNDELGSLDKGLKSALTILTPGGRMAAISFHSLEDRTVKNFFIAESKDCLCPPQQPVCTCAHRASLRIVTRRPVTADADEVQANPRARSAKLRVAEKL
ncbi:MAG TPA: 16S rRNA (cytosine(1402)-N(4))-methyltransferase RsmH [Candidatus Dormibacteraeota bacterium]